MSIQTQVSAARSRTRSTFCEGDLFPEVEAEVRELQRRRHAEPPPARLLDEVAVHVGGRGGGPRRGDVLAEIGHGRLEPLGLEAFQDVERVGRGLAGDEAPDHPA